MAWDQQKESRPARKWKETVKRNGSGYQARFVIVNTCLRPFRTITTAISNLHPESSYSFSISIRRIIVTLIIIPPAKPKHKQGCIALPAYVFIHQPWAKSFIFNLLKLVDVFFCSSRDYVTVHRALSLFLGCPQTRKIGASHSSSRRGKRWF